MKTVMKSLRNAQEARGTHSIFDDFESEFQYWPKWLVVTEGYV